MIKLRTSLFFKLIVSVLLSVVIPFIITNIISYRTNYKLVKEEFIALNKGVLDMGMVEFKDYLDRLGKIATPFYISEINILSQLDSKEKYTGGERYYITRHLQHIMALNDDMLFVKITGAYNHDTISYSKSTNPISSFSFAEGYSGNGSETIYSIPSGQGNLEGSMIVVSECDVINVPGRKVLGKVRAYMSNKPLTELSYKLTGDEKNEEILIYFNGEKQPFFSSTNGENKIPDRGTKEYSDGKLNGENGVFIFCSDQYKKTPILLVKFISNSLMNQSAIKTLGTSLIIQGTSLICILIFMAVLYMLIISPVKRILSNIEHVEMGKFEIEETTSNKDELSILEGRFQDMVESLNDLINREYRSVLEASKARLKMLQAQINPHFLYNMLQYISTLALKQNALEVSEKLSDLSSIFRYNMEAGDDVVKLQKELAHISNYMSLQAGRFGNQIDFRVSCPKEALDVRVPKMILQPLVENSIQHGMKNQCRNCSISIHISLQDCLTIKIIDNGEGIDGATISKIKERYEKYGLNNESGDGIGIVNVLQRLKIYSNNRFTWSIESIPYEATVISLILQKEGGEGDEAAPG